MQVSFKGRLYDYEEGLDSFLKDEDEYDLTNPEIECSDTLTSEIVSLSRNCFGKDGQLACVYVREKIYLLGVDQRDMGKFFLYQTKRIKEKLIFSEDCDPSIIGRFVKLLYQTKSSTQY